MNKNPYINATAAFAYVAIIGTFLQNGKYIFGEQDPVFAPIMFLSLFVLSASLMGYLILGLPAQLLIEGHKKQAIDTFLRTIGTFAAYTVAIWAIAAILA